MERLRNVIRAPNSFRIIYNRATTAILPVVWAKKGPPAATW